MGFERTRWLAWCWRTALLSSFLALHVISSVARGSSLGEGSAANSLPEGVEGSPLSPPAPAPPAEALVRPKRELPVLYSAPRRRRAYRAPVGLHEEAGMRLPIRRAGRTNQRPPLDVAEEHNERGEDAWAYDRPIAADGSPLGPPPPALPPLHILSQSDPLVPPSLHAHSQSDPMGPPHHHGHGQSEDGVISVGFHDASSVRVLGSEAQAEPLQGGDPTSWTLSDFYDYLSPDYSTTEAYPEDEDAPTSPDMEDENLRSTTALSNRWAQLPGGVAGGDGGQGLPGDAGGCSRGYVRSNGTCRSPCELFTNYCFNGGQCYEVEGVGAFCRCNVQEYVWNKGTRCESIITDFQVMCLLVGGASVTLLLLFMIVVFFAKRLHVLRQENTRLRRRSKYRPQSEHHDNFSVSTIAEGSQTNEEPVKEEELVKSPSPVEPMVKSPSFPDALKLSDSQEGAEPITIQNSVTPTHDNSKPLYDDKDPAPEEGVTIDLELLLPKEAKMHPPSSAPLEYDIFLHKLPNAPVLLPDARGRSGAPAPGGSMSTLALPQSSEPSLSSAATRSLPSLLSCRPDPPLAGACAAP
ncbi:hypothetical protein ACEWY4_023642 [Coilia grayii]|uniref:Neural chondroitin sulphate proteoglycan cytoplasmic domain-containing protein n=1 Tax=Coilia grayii TaxID=363190 RepID=A0ABD1IY34_9TELE